MATKIVSDGVSKDSVIETLPDHSVARDIEAHAAWIEGLRVPKPTKGQPSVGCHNDGVKNWVCSSAFVGVERTGCWLVCDVLGASCVKGI